MSDPVITTIVPTCNRPVFLRKCLSSLLSQTFKNFKVFILDNASDAETALCVQEVVGSDLRFEYFRHEVNIGAVENFCYGLNLIKTPYFTILSDDDFLLPCFYELAVKGIEKYPDAGFFCGTVVEVNDRHDIVGLKTSHWPNQEYFSINEGYPKMIDMHLDWMAVLFKVSVLDVLGGINKKVKAIDYDFMVRASLFFPFVVSREPMAVFVHHAGSYSFNAGLKLFYPGFLEILQSIMSDSRLKFEIRNRACRLIRNALKKLFFRYYINCYSQEKYTDLETIKLAYIGIFENDFTYMIMCAFSCLKVGSVFALSLLRLRLKIKRLGFKIRAPSIKK